MTRPSEALQAIVGTVVGSVLIIVAAITKVDVPGEVSGAIVTLVSFIAWGVTAYVSNRQRAGALPSAQDGAVHPE